MKLFLLLLLSLNILNASVTRKSSTNIVYDTTTNLEWLDSYDGYDTNLTWEKAIDFCENYTSVDADAIETPKSDWRLPNINELKSLIDYTRSKPAIIGGEGVFIYVNQSSDYWSSTTKLASTKDRAYTVIFQYGKVSYEYKRVGINTSFRCVRNKGE